LTVGSTRIPPNCFFSGLGATTGAAAGTDSLQHKNHQSANSNIFRSILTSATPTSLSVFLPFSENSPACLARAAKQSRFTSGNPNSHALPLETQTVTLCFWKAKQSRFASGNPNSHALPLETQGMICNALYCEYRKFFFV